MTLSHRRSSESLISSLQTIDDVAYTVNDLEATKQYIVLRYHYHKTLGYSTEQSKVPHELKNIFICFLCVWHIAMICGDALDDIENTEVKVAEQGVEHDSVKHRVHSAYCYSCHDLNST